jgi:hypothetical protein
VPTFSFQSINVPNPVFSYIYISVNGVDSAGDAVGNYGDSDGNYLGFVANSNSSNGTPFDPPNSSYTDVVGITPAAARFSATISTIGTSNTDSSSKTVSSRTVLELSA